MDREQFEASSGVSTDWAFEYEYSCTQDRPLTTKMTERVRLTNGERWHTYIREPDPYRCAPGPWRTESASGFVEMTPDMLGAHRGSIAPVMAPPFSVFESVAPEKMADAWNATLDLISTRPWPEESEYTMDAEKRTAVRGRMRALLDETLAPFAQ